MSVPVEILGPGDFIKHARVLASEQVIAIEDDRVSFFHETFFDFTFARQWLSRQQSMVEFLCAQEQELFRRAQVRQILELLRERDPDRFRNEIEAVLSSVDVRFHLKETVVAVFANVSAPTLEDVELVMRLTETESTLTKRLWLQLARPTWFGPFYAHGHIERWLDSDDAALRDRSVNWMANAGAEHGAEVADLLTARNQSPDYVTWLRWVTQRADLHHDRRLFELLLDAVRAGEISPADQNVWLSAHELAEHEPLWAIEMLKSLLCRQSVCPGARCGLQSNPPWHSRVRRHSDDRGSMQSRAASVRRGVRAASAGSHGRHALRPPRAGPSSRPALQPEASNGAKATTTSMTRCTTARRTRSDSGRRRRRKPSSRCCSSWPLTNTTRRSRCCIAP